MYRDTGKTKRQPVYETVCDGCGEVITGKSDDCFAVIHKHETGFGEDYFKNHYDCCGKAECFAAIGKIIAK